MEAVDVIKLRGAFRLREYTPSGEVVNERVINNLMVTAGRAWALGQLFSDVHVTSRNLSHIAIGSGLVAPATGNTALGNEVTRKAIGTFTTTGLTDNPPNVISAVSFATNEGNTTLGEIGMFNSNSGGTMLNRATFASFVKATSNTLGATYTVSS